ADEAIALTAGTATTASASVANPALATLLFLTANRPIIISPYSTQWPQALRPAAPYTTQLPGQAVPCIYRNSLCHRGTNNTDFVNLYRGGCTLHFVWPLGIISGN